MKKIMKMMAMVLVAVAMTAGFAACSSDDDNNNIPSTAVTHGQLTAKCFVTADLLKIADVAIHYTGADGKEITKNLTENDIPFEEKVKYDLSSFPITATVYMTCTLKDNYEQAATYDLGYYDMSSIWALDNAEGTHGGVTHDILPGSGYHIKGKTDNVAKIVSIINKSMSSHKITVKLDKSGGTPLLQ